MIYNIYIYIYANYNICLFIYLYIYIKTGIHIDTGCPGGKSEEIPFTTSAKQVLEDSVICAQERGHGGHGGHGGHAVDAKWMVICSPKWAWSKWRLVDYS